jgi:hypothetical protein
LLKQAMIPVLHGAFAFIVLALKATVAPIAGKCT